MLKIMGQAAATVTQMQTYIKKVNPKVPDSVIKMIPLYISEGAVEGVRGDIAFAQSCLETGNFTFSGSAVTLDQNNFCGMGVIKNGVKGNSFKTPQLGIRAQVQHLQAYGSTGRLKQTVVDPRYTYVTRGGAEYVEYLGNKIICYSIPIRPGRNVAVIVESAAVNFRQKKMGYDALEEFYKRVQNNMIKYR